jgi:DNA-binding response OmpR family regulator
MATSRTVILIYSDDATVRASVRAALGAKVSPAVLENEIYEFATGAALHAFIDSQRGGKVADLIILDGEAVPEGGMGIARQLKDEVFNCPPVLLITARPDDAWLATWSRAEATVMHPIDPFTFAGAAAALLTLRQNSVPGAAETIQQ